MRSALWETFVTVVFAAVVLAGFLALVFAGVALLVVVPLAFLVVQATGSRGVGTEPIVLLQAREIASGAWARSSVEDLSIARTNSDERGITGAGQ